VGVSKRPVSGCDLPTAYPRTYPRGVRRRRLAPRPTPRYRAPATTVERVGERSKRHSGPAVVGLLPAADGLRTTTLCMASSSFGRPLGGGLTGSPQVSRVANACGAPISLGREMIRAHGPDRVPNHVPSSADLTPANPSQLGYLSQTDREQAPPRQLIIRRPVVRFHPGPPKKAPLRRYRSVSFGRLSDERSIRCSPCEASVHAGLRGVGTPRGHRGCIGPGRFARAPDGRQARPPPTPWQCRTSSPTL
jgi:hypothetical protein